MHGGYLDPAKVKEARAKEIDEYLNYDALEPVPLDECWRETGGPPCSTRWADTNKGDRTNPDYRSRLVARELKSKQLSGEETSAGDASDLFASTPPLEALRELISMAASRRASRNGKPLKLGLYDVKGAYFNALATRKFYVDLVDELLPKDMQGIKWCGRLKKSMYGTRDAGANWEKELTDCLKKAGFAQGMSCPNVYFNAEKDIATMVHGDDEAALTDDDGLKYVEDVLNSRYKISVRGRLGGEVDDDREGRILNRYIRWTSLGLELEADPRHAQLIVQQMGVDSGKGVETPGIKQTYDEAMLDNPELDRDEQRKFRSICMRAAYLSQDRSDIQFSVKAAAREMHAPTARSWNTLKRIARYLLKYPRLVIHFTKQQMPSHIDVFTDSDHAGCLRTRKSTTGLTVMIGGHCGKTSATTRSTIALSSPKSEYYGMVNGSSVGLGMQALTKDFGLDLKLRVHTDASSGLALSQRRGLGRARHISTRFLWLQQKVKRILRTLAQSTCPAR